MGIGRRLKEARLACKLTQKDLAEAVGVTKGAIGNYENETSHPRDTILYDLMNVLNVDANYLFQDTVKIIDPAPTPWHKPLDDAYVEANIPTQENVCKLLDLEERVVPFETKPAEKPVNARKTAPDNVVPFEPRMISKLVYDDKAAAGEPITAESDYQHLEFSEGEVPYNADFGIRIKGMSMAPDIEDGDLVWVHKQYAVPDNQVGVFMIDGEAVCKRAITNHRGELTKLQSDNEEHPDIWMRDLDEYTVVRPVGRVVGTCKAVDVPKQ